MTDDMVESHT